VFDRKEITALADKLNSGTIADVLDGLGYWGVLPYQIRSVSQGQGPRIGRAHTVRWAPVRKPLDIMAKQPSTWESVGRFLVPEVSDGKGLMYVAGSDDGLLQTLALAGGFSCANFETLGYEAIVLGGAVRDAHVVSKLKTPVLATNFTPADTQGNYRVVETGTWCRVGDIVVNTGDWVFIDASGAVVIPDGLLDEAIQRSLSLEAVEHTIAERVAQGEALFDVVNSLGRL
jgi:regulator of RNase E activity RraA